MAAITIKDLPLNRTLDSQARSSIRGGNALWVYGWITEFRGNVRPQAPVVNFFQTNNIFVADQMNNQIQVIDIENSATNATFNVAPGQVAINAKV